MKVYLSKASRAPAHIVAAVRNDLLKRDLELVEATEPFNGHQKMLECDRVVFIPNSLRPYGTTETLIGKGQTDQLNTWLGASKDERPILVVGSSDATKDLYRLSEISEDVYVDDDDNDVTVDIRTPTDFINYGAITDDNDYWHVDDPFGEEVRQTAGPSTIDGSGPCYSGDIHLQVAVDMGII